MEYTEEVKTEADSVVEEYKESTYSTHWKTIKNERIDATKRAIKDRQSVLKVTEMAYNTCRVVYDDYYHRQIQSLTQQIEYLQSKL